MAEPEAILANQDAADPVQHIPFVAHIRVVPDRRTGKRIEYWRNLEKIAKRVQQDLVDAGWNIATPVAFTPQIGDSSARLTIIGSWTKTSTTDGRQNVAATTDINIIHSGTGPGTKTATMSINRGGSLSYGEDTTATVDAEVKDLREQLAADSTQFEARDVIHIEYNNVKYGNKKIGGRSFPR